MSNRTNTIHDLIEISELQRLQDEFCKVTGIACACIDGNRNLIARTSGSLIPEDFLAFLESAQMDTLLNLVGEDSLEDILLEDMETDDGENGKLAVMSIRMEGIICYWVLIFSSVIGERVVYDILDLLRDTSHALLGGKMEQYSAEEKSTRSQDAEAEMSRTIHTLKATTDVVKLLDSTAAIETVMQQWLQILTDYLQVDRAQILRLSGNGDLADILAECLAIGQPSYMDVKTGIPTHDYMRVERPLVISTEQIYNQEYRLISEQGIKALVSFPLLLCNEGKDGTLIVVLSYHQKGHQWESEEEKFIWDAACIMQSIVVGRINKNSVAGSFHALEEVLNHIGCSVYLTNRRNGKILFVNRMLTSTFDKEWRDGSLLDLIRQGHEKEEASSQDGGSFEIFHEDRGRWYDVIYKDLQWVDGSEATAYSIYDITDRKLYQRKIEQQAFTDFLTGLYNRMCCERDLARMIDEAKKNHQSGALIYLDLDDFKHINDGLGHQYGDILLKAISESLRRIDGIENNCYRMGGDEFVVLVSSDVYARFDEILERIRLLFAKPWYLKDTDYYCTASLGTVTFPDMGDSVPDLIKKADIAMYEAKKTGKNRMAHYSEGQASISGRRLDMEKNMRDAEKSGYHEFEVYFQPIIDIEDGQQCCVGAEALVRWNSDRLGFISPADFIPLAEYLGLINPIGNHVLLTACQCCKKWNDSGYPNMKVNVNLSVVQLLQNDIVDLVAEILQETQLSPKNLTLEVTESLAINDMVRMKVILSKIKELGVSIALDDFGTGYSSLNHIREIPFDVIKVDQSFVRDLAEDAYSQSFVKMVAELADTLGVKICVEGIETGNQFKVLTGMKVKYIQGYYFDKPLPQKDFEEKYVRDKGEETR